MSDATPRRTDSLGESRRMYSAIIVHILVSVTPETSVDDAADPATSSDNNFNIDYPRKGYADDELPI